MTGSLYSESNTQNPTNTTSQSHGHVFEEVFFLLPVFPVTPSFILLEVEVELAPAARQGQAAAASPEPAAAAAVEWAEQPKVVAIVDVVDLCVSSSQKPITLERQ